MDLSHRFACTAFARFINSPAGRVTRVIAGVVLILWGIARAGEAGGYLLIVAGLVPLVAGALDLCLISVLVGGPISGKSVRSMNSPT